MSLEGLIVCGGAALVVVTVVIASALFFSGAMFGTIGLH
jgi:hypothetical protein